MNWKGDFKNETGYTLVKIPGTNDPAMYEFQIDFMHPLEYHIRAGGVFQPDRHWKTDMGSIPVFIQALTGINKDSFLLSFLLHDCACIHKGLFWKYPGAAGFIFRPLNRATRDELLRDCIRAEGGSWLQAQAVYRAVRLYAICTFQWTCLGK